MKRKVEERKPNNNGKGREKTEAFLDGLEVGKEGGGEICKTFAIPRRLGLPPPLFDRGEIEIKDEYYSRRRRLHSSSLSARRMANGAVPFAPPPPLSGFG